MNTLIKNSLKDLLVTVIGGHDYRFKFRFDTETKATILEIFENEKVVSVVSFGSEKSYSVEELFKFI